MRRVSAAISLLMLVLAACAAEPVGPSAPIAVELLTPATALDASAARQTVVDFVDAYAASPTEGAGALASLVTGEDLESWVRWLDVQHREFTGSIAATADVRDVEFVTSLEADRLRGAHVGLSASVTFAYEPEGDAAFKFARILDGPVTLRRLDAGSYRVVDLLRDGVQMTSGIETFEDETRTRRGAEVRLDSLFMFPPNWQFNVVIRNLGSEPMLVDPGASGLYVEDDEGFGRVEGLFTGSLTVVPPGAEVDGIVAFPAQASEGGRVLTLVYTSGRGIARFEFPLEGLVSVIPPLPPTGEEEDPTATI
ncbi:MAG: hypothetical protein ACXWXP_02065 [Actinomycetota bacterium]